jgi:DNA polymerase-3 subunit gamma/tau
VYVQTQTERPQERHREKQDKVEHSQAAATKALDAALSPIIADAGNLKEVWEAVLKELIHSGKRSVHACISQGSLIQLTEKEATVRFAAAFPKERTEKEDYRTIVEKIFMQVCGNAVQLSCILGTETLKPQPIKTEPKASLAEKPPEAQHPALKQALAMFGGKVIQQEDK